MHDDSAPRDLPARVLIVEPDPDLRGLEVTILADDGYQVETVPDEADPVTVAARTSPDVIVLGISRPNDQQSWQVLDQLQASPQTRTIPVVVISTSERAVAAAQASPIVGSTGKAVIAPYDIEAFEEAVRHALKNPPPAATLPRTKRQPAPAVVFAAEALSAHAREVAIQTVEKLREIEPYRSRFAELTKGLVDDIGTVLGAIADGLRRGLAPREVFRVSTIQHSIERHVRLRKDQGVNLPGTLREYWILRGEIDGFLRGLVGQHGFTAQDAGDVSKEVHSYILELARVVGEDAAGGT